MATWILEGLKNADTLGALFYNKRFEEAERRLASTAHIDNTFLVEALELIFRGSEAVHLLLRYGANPDIALDYEGWSLMMRCVQGFMNGGKRTAENDLMELFYLLGASTIQGRGTTITHNWPGSTYPHILKRRDAILRRRMGVPSLQAQCKRVVFQNRVPMGGYPPLLFAMPDVAEEHQRQLDLIERWHLREEWQRADCDGPLEDTEGSGYRKAAPPMFIGMPYTHIPMMAAYYLAAMPILR